MNKEYFVDYIKTIYQIFNRRVPDLEVQQLWYERVKDWPLDFFEWSKKNFAGMDKIPDNVGSYIISIYPDWKSLNKHKFTKRYDGCHDCSGIHDKLGQGYYAFRREEGDVLFRYFIPCQCKGVFSPKDKPDYFIIPKSQAKAQGFTLIPQNFKGSVLAYEMELRGQYVNDDSDSYIQAEREALYQEKYNKLLAKIGA